jgi:hypothetical protein
MKWYNKLFLILMALGFALMPFELVMPIEWETASLAIVEFLLIVGGWIGFVISVIIRGNI